MGRPNTLGERVLFTVAVTQEMADRLDRVAADRGQKRAQLVRLILKEGLERVERIAAIAEAIERVEAAS